MQVLTTTLIDIGGDRVVALLGKFAFGGLMLGGDRVVALLLPGQRDTVAERDALPYRACSATAVRRAPGEVNGKCGEPVKKQAHGGCWGGAVENAHGKTVNTSYTHDHMPQIESRLPYL